MTGIETTSMRESETQANVPLPSASPFGLLGEHCRSASKRILPIHGQPLLLATPELMGATRGSNLAPPPYEEDKRSITSIAWMCMMAVLSTLVSRSRYSANGVNASSKCGWFAVEVRRFTSAVYPPGAARPRSMNGLELQACRLTSRC